MKLKLTDPEWSGRTSDEAVHRYKGEIVVAGSSCPQRQIRQEDRARGDRTLAPTRWCVTVARERGRIVLSSFRDRKTALRRRDRREDQQPTRMAGYST